GGALVREGAHVVHHVPDRLILHAIAFGRHLIFALLDDVEQFAVAAVLQGRGIGFIVHAQLHVNGHIALAVSLFAVTHGAVVAVLFLAAGQRFRRGGDGILLASRLLWNGVVSRSGSRLGCTLCGLRLLRHGERQQRQQRSVIKVFHMMASSLPRRHTR